jgi:DNA-binding SARP family transcriptional activator
VTVTEPSDAWNLAERFLGDGRRWKELWLTNRDSLQPDGARWSDPEATVRAGWELVVPAALTAPDTPAPTAGQPTGNRVAEGKIIVEAGDNFWVLAERRLAEAWGRAPMPHEVAPYWQHMININRERLAPPGDPDLIYPGQVFITPAAPPDPTVNETGNAPPALPPSDVPPPATEREANTTVPPAVEEAPPDAEPEPPVVPDGDEPIDDGRTATTPTGPPVGGETPAQPPVAGGENTGDAEQAPAPRVPGGDEDEPDDGTSDLVPLAQVGVVGAAGVAVAVGVTRALRRRRRRGNHLAPAAQPATGGDDGLLRGLEVAADEDRIEVLCRAIDDLAAEVAAAGQRCRPRVVQHGAEHVDVLLDEPTVPAVAGWEAQADGAIWSLNPSQVGQRTGGGSMAGPLLVTLGCPDEGGQLYLDLEAAGVVSLTGDGTVAQNVAATMLVELAHSPFAANAQVIAVGDLGTDRLADLERVRTVEDWSEVAADLTAWASQSREALAANGWPNPFVARGADPDHDALIPLVVVAAKRPGDPEMAHVILGGPTAAAAVFVGEQIPGATVIECHRDQLVVPQLGLRCRPQVLEPADIDGVVELMEVAEDSGGQLAWAFSPEVAPMPEHQAGSGEGGNADPSYEILVRLLGDITVDGGEAPLTGKQTALVAYIALHVSVSADRLIDAIWAGAASVSPRKRLANTVTKCRAALGARHLPVVKDNHYSIGSGVATDADLFERRVAAAAQMAPESAAGMLRGALDLVRGPVFEYPSTERESYSWVSVENWISIWELKITTAAQRAAELYLELGEPAQAVDVAERMLRVVPTHAGLTEALMRAHDARGDRLAARRVFYAHAEALEQLDLDTVAESTAKLYEQLRSG